MEQARFSVLVLALNMVSKLVPMVRAGEGHTRHKHEWRLPGGCSKFGEFPEEAAIREMKEETGLQIEDLQHVHTVVKAGGHEQHVFIAALHSVDNVLKTGNEGEIVTLFNVNEILLERDLFSPHRIVISKVFEKLSRESS